MTAGVYVLVGKKAEVRGIFASEEDAHKAFNEDREYCKRVESWALMGDQKIDATVEDGQDVVLKATIRKVNTFHGEDVYIDLKLREGEVMPVYLW